MDFDLLKVPAPIVTPLTVPFWQAAEKGHLLIQRCEACDHFVFYPRPICPRCWGDRLVWREASGSGTLQSWSTVHRSGHPAWQPATPYTVGVVKLSEGPTMLSLILGSSPDALAFGAPVKLKPTRVAGRTLPTFDIESGVQKADRL
ncbi:hypothetical protein N182_29930 [Sinorhizobium sp. GL2]|nr:hypothetical protein N182_29930 [Sinorhizobium sp. GL2]